MTKAQAIQNGFCRKSASFMPIASLSCGGIFFHLMKLLRRVSAMLGVILSLLPLLVAENSAKIFVYCPWDSLQRSRLTISFDNIRGAEIQPGRFFLLNVKAGSHVLIPGPGVPLVVDIGASEEAFVRVGRRIEMGPGGTTDSPMLDLPDPEVARLDLVNLVYVAPKKIHSDSVAKTDPFSHQVPKLKTRNSSE